jgi:ribonuclease HI
VVAEVIDKTGSWAYFDGAAQRKPPIGGAGGILYLSDSHFLKFKVGIGRSTNNKAELLALKLTLRLAVEHGVQKLQVMGDSMVFKNYRSWVIPRLL